jgi:hypothetical protein
MPKIPDLPVSPASTAAGLLVIDQAGVTNSITRDALLEDDADKITLKSGHYVVQVWATGTGITLNVDTGGGYVQVTSTSVNIACQPSGFVAFTIPGPGLFRVVDDVGDALVVGKDASGSVALQLSRRLDISFSYAAATPGSVIAAFPIYDLTGTLIGYVPIYDAIT